MGRSIFGFVLVVLMGCVPPVVPPGPNLSDAAPPGPSPAGACAQACAALLAAHCPEGSVADCASTLQHLDDDGLIHTPNGATLTCASVALVQTPTQARAAGIACASP
jgi:hypothetical protein